MSEATWNKTSLASKRSPFDPAPDWVGQTYGQRISGALVSLKLFGFLTEREAASIAAKIDEWFDMHMQSRYTTESY